MYYSVGFYSRGVNEKIGELSLPLKKKNSYRVFSIIPNSLINNHEGYTEFTLVDTNNFNEISGNGIIDITEDNELKEMQIQVYWEDMDLLNVTVISED